MHMKQQRKKATAPPTDIMITIMVSGDPVWLASPLLAATAAMAAASLNLGPTGGSVIGAGVGDAVHGIAQEQGQLVINWSTSASVKLTTVRAMKQLSSI
mmetsp:Transcript_33927/g.74435  ORF Transcript_33927/g.74435 Transcript_33927/m.74435 type:complete len:99 (-) Transcript_33927:146-442(-)